MFQKLGYVLRIMILKLKNGSRLHLNGIVRVERGVEIRAKNGNVNLEKGTRFREGTYIAAITDGTVSIDEGTFFNRNCTVVCQESVKVGKGCAFGPNVTIYDHDHKFGVNGIEEGYNRSPIVIEDRCWIGAGAMILKGTYIGEGCVIGAGTVVKGTIPPHSIVTYENGRQLKISPIVDK